VPTKNEKQPLSNTHPNLATEANGWDPKNFTFGSGKAVSWKCSKGHVWYARIYSITNGNGCPICANDILLTGYNDLATVNPKLALEADGWDPSQVLSGTNKKLNWKCAKCNYKWSASANQRQNHKPYKYQNKNIIFH
jgi:hypothetical protein